MLSKIKKFINKCQLCQKNKFGRIIKSPMVVTTTSTKPFERIFLDVVGPLPITYGGNRYILTMQDDLTKFSIAVCLPNQETETIAKAFVSEFICHFGSPISILTDQGSNFMSKMFQSCCKLLKIKKLHCSAYHPQTNGALERSHRTLGEYLRNYTSKDQQNWDSWISFAIFCYNSTPHSSHSFMPFELLFGFKPNIPTSIKRQPDIVYNYDDYVTELKARLQNSWKVAKESLLINKHQSKSDYDKNVHFQSFNVGDKAFLKNELKSKNKLDELWSGPYTVIAILSNSNTEIQIGRKTKIVHNNRLKICNS